MITRMQPVHYLNCQDTHDTPTRRSCRDSYAQLKILAAINHVFEQMIDSVLMHASAFSNDLSNLAADCAEKTRGARLGTMTRIVREDAQQITIVNCGPIKVVLLAFATIVFAQR